MLLNLRHRIPSTDFQQISTHLPGRSSRSCETQYNRLQSHNGQERVRRLRNNNTEDHADERVGVNAAELDPGYNTSDTLSKAKALPLPHTECNFDGSELLPHKLPSFRRQEESVDRASALSTHLVEVPDQRGIQTVPRPSSQLSRRDMEDHLDGLRHSCNRVLTEATELIFPVVQKLLAQHSDLQRQHDDWFRHMAQHDANTFRVLSGNTRFDLPSMNNLTLKRGNIRVHLKCDSRGTADAIVCETPKTAEVVSPSHPPLAVLCATDRCDVMNKVLPNGSQAGNPQNSASVVDVPTESVMDGGDSRICEHCGKLSLSLPPP